jgi:hypothetical protein
MKSKILAWKKIIIIHFFFYHFYQPQFIGKMVKIIYRLIGKLLVKAQP